MWSKRPARHTMSIFPRQFSHIHSSLSSEEELGIFLLDGMGKHKIPVLGQRNLISNFENLMQADVDYSK